MSETKHYKGKLTPTGKTPMQYAPTVDPVDFEEEYWETTYVIGGQVFEMQREEQDPDGVIADAVKNEDGSYTFDVRYYNGGADFSEILDMALTRADLEG